MSALMTNLNLYLLVVWDSMCKFFCLRQTLEFEPVAVQDHPYLFLLSKASVSALKILWMLQF